MNLRYRPLAISIALLMLALALAWMFAPQQMLAAWGIASTPAAELVGRRAAALYAGVGLMFWLARKAPASPARAAMSLGLAVASSLLAALGIIELVAARVSTGILVAVAIEVVMALALLLSTRTGPDSGPALTTKKRKST